MNQNLLSRLRTVFACLLLFAFGFCMVNILSERGLVVKESLANLLPDLLSTAPAAMRDDMSAQKRSHGFPGGDWHLPPPPPPERLIIVDAGHGGMDGGTQGNGLLEKNWALKIAQALAGDLRQRGFKVKMTREGDDTLELSDRTDIANLQTNHLFVSVHLNYSAEPSVSGIETFYSLKQSLSTTNAIRKEFETPTGAPMEDLRSELLAQVVQENVTQVTGANDRGKKQQSFFVLRNSIAPAVLVECGFVSNQQEAEHIVKSSYRKRLARGIANGITAFLNDVQSDSMYGVTITPELPAAPEALVQVPAAESRESLY
ncbi:MAG: N-acetylmuramoyl-L-alanine amidase [Verrucomicrobiales bacterium]|jgi:N-acetylmuramoyl-L-alanine amidase